MIEHDFFIKDGDYPSSFVNRVRLVNFRNYAQLDLELGQRFNLISGQNGQGKTNFLEALHMIATTRLLRGQREVEAVKDGENLTEVKVELEPFNTLLSMQIERGARKRVFINGMKMPRASDVMGRLPCVCISTEDMEIVRGDPAERRLFLDLELSSRSPSYLRHLTVYKRSLEQRNALVKQARETHVPNELWEVWEVQLAEHGISIRAMRQEFLAELAKRLPGLHSRIGGGEEAGLQLVCKEAINGIAEGMAALAHSRQMDVARGSTTVGPHRDDIEFLVGGRSARLFGSQGQQRTFVVALKLSTLVLAQSVRGQPPLLLLDDIFSDLDAHRRSALVEIVLEVAGQTVLTCTEPEAAGPEILDRADIFHVNEGQIRKAS